jgi:4-phosphopantoate--beta-alanine ligase
MGKKVITIDLNPVSRTAKAAQITIIDNIIRAIPEMIVVARKLKGKNESVLKKTIKEFDNKTNLSESLKIIQDGSVVAGAISRK